MYLRGVGVEPVEKAENKRAGLAVSAICVSSHLTMFGVADEGEESVETDKHVLKIADRFQAMATVDLAAGSTKLNGIIPSALGIATLLLLALVAFSRLRGSHEAAVQEARQVFAQSGFLKKPHVVGEITQEAILRGFVTVPQSIGLLALQMFSADPLVSMFFEWSHEHVVYTR